MDDRAERRQRFYDPESRQGFEAVKENEDLLVIDGAQDEEYVLVRVYRRVPEEGCHCRKMMMAQWYLDRLPRASAFDVACFLDADAQPQKESHPALGDVVDGPDRRHVECTDVSREAFREVFANAEETVGFGIVNLEDIFSEKHALDGFGLPEEEASAVVEGNSGNVVAGYPEAAAASVEGAHEGESAVESPETPSDSEVSAAFSGPGLSQPVTDERLFTVNCADPDTVSITGLNQAAAGLRDVVVPPTFQGQPVTSISLSSFGLDSLDVSHCAGLLTLNCLDNNLRKLDVSNCPKLETLNCVDNPLKVLDMRGCSPKLYARYDPDVQVLA